MGLILSVLVACVGVYKFLQIYCETTGGEKFQLRATPPIEEDVEIECKSKIWNTESRFLVTETDVKRSRSPSPRKFLITKDEGASTDLREFVITGAIVKRHENNKEFVLIDTNENYKEIPLLPLPEQFVITQKKIDENIKKNIKNAIGIKINTLKYNGNTIEDKVLSLDKEVLHRDPSPYPALKFPIHSPTSNLNRIDEVEYKENSKKIDVILHTHNNVTEYTSNRILVVPPECINLKKKNKQRSKSECRNDVNEPRELRKSSSSSNIHDKDEPTSIFINLLKNGENEEFRRSLDGVKRTSESRKSFKKRKNRSQNSLDNEENNEFTGKTPPENSRLIFSGEYTKAMNRDWHGQHFCCWQCDESLTGQRYVLRDDHPYCVSCYESVFANACEKCSRTIGIDSKDLSYKDKHWHEACFLCTTCGESLVDKQFGSKGDRIYCGRCYDNQFASRCDGCNEIFRAGTKKMEYKTRQWHEKCFCCCVCKVPIGTQSFIPREQEIYCAKCYEEKFATRCIKCNKVITSGGVTYKNEPWHRECFTCTHCSKSLAGERFTSRDEKPYCAECFGELFAKRCFACNKPITGIGGTKFISFEDRHWHNDCFFCASCRSSLVGRGFITDQDDIICPECAKQKLL